MAESKVVLITGANTGVGFHICRALYGSNESYSLIVAGRSMSKVLDAIKSLEAEFPTSPNSLTPLLIDLEVDETIFCGYNDFAKKFNKVDALVNNAGAQFDREFKEGRMTERAMWQKTYDLNVIGTQIMTSTFVPLLLKSKDPRLLFVTSGTATLSGTEDRSIIVNRIPSKGWPKAEFSLPSYRTSKCALNMMMREWHRILKEDGVKVWCLSPGLLATNLGNNPEMLKKIGAGDPAVAGPFIKDILEGRRDDDTGLVVIRDGVQPW